MVDQHALLCRAELTTFMFASADKCLYTGLVSQDLQDSFAYLHGGLRLLGTAGRCNTVLSDALPGWAGAG